MFVCLLQNPEMVMIFCCYMCVCTLISSFIGLSSAFQPGCMYHQGDARLTEPVRDYLPNIDESVVLGEKPYRLPHHIEAVAGQQARQPVPQTKQHVGEPSDLTIPSSLSLYCYSFII